MASDEQAIRQLVDTWLAASKAGDIETVLSLMADDVVFLVPGQPARGKAEFAAAARAQAAPDGPRFDATSEIREIRILGDWAFMWTRLTVVVTPPGNGPAVTCAGHTLSVLEKRAGTWVLARDANLLAPLSQPAEGAGVPAAPAVISNRSTLQENVMSAPERPPKATVIPCLRYRDAPAAITWLCDAFGFERHAVYSNPDGTIAHAQLTCGNGMVMLGSVLEKETEWGRLIQQPDAVGGAETQSPYVMVADADAVYARAKAAGVPIVIDIKDEDYGGRGFSCRDPEGHLWNFGTYDPW